MARQRIDWGSCRADLETRLPELEKTIRKHVGPVVVDSEFSNYSVSVGDLPPRIEIIFGMGVSEVHTHKTREFENRYSQKVADAIGKASEEIKLRPSRVSLGYYQLKPYYNKFRI